MEISEIAVGDKEPEGGQDCREDFGGCGFKEGDGRPRRDGEGKERELRKVEKSLVAYRGNYRSKRKRRL